MDGTLLIFDDVRGVCSPADANRGEPVPTRVTAADRRSQTGFRVLRVWSWAGRTGVRVTWVNVGHSLPPQVNPQVARLGARALVAQGIEHRFPNPTLRLCPQADDLRLLSFRASCPGRTGVSL
jgi:hypothetical protein